MEPLQIIIIVAFSYIVAYVAISRFIKFRKKNKEPKNIVFDCIPIIYLKGSREAEIFRILNEEVVKRGRKPFKLCGNICSLTWDRVREMDASGEIDHLGSRNEVLALKELGSDDTADLISKYYGTPRGVVGKEAYISEDGKTILRKGFGFLGSPLHRKAIMNPKYDYCGLSSLIRANNRYIDVLMLVDEKTVN